MPGCDTVIIPRHVTELIRRKIASFNQKVTSVWRHWSAAYVTGVMIDVITSKAMSVLRISSATWHAFKDGVSLSKCATYRQLMKAKSLLVRVVLLTYCWHTSGTLTTLCWQEINTKMTLCWQDIDWPEVGTCFTRCWHEINKELTPNWHQVDMLLTKVDSPSESRPCVHWSDTKWSAILPRFCRYIFWCVFGVHFALFSLSCSH